jgi:hypothetical protein
MQRIKPWLERDFSFDTPKWMFPHVVERIRGGPARLEDKYLCELAGLPPRLT